MTRTLSDLSHTVRAQLHAILLGGDTAVAPSAAEFITWCAPGIPFRPGDFRFAAGGLGSGMDADEERVLLQQAFSFASLVDFIPRPEATYTAGDQATILRARTDERLSEVYGQALRASTVIDDTATDQEKAKLAQLGAELWETRLENRLVDGALLPVPVLRETPMMSAYNEYEQKYLAARTLYNTKRLDALTSGGEQGNRAVADWSANAALYRMQVSAALSEWAVKGRRDEVDAIKASVSQAAERSMVTWKARLLGDFDEAVLTATGPGQQFRFTTIVPGGFAEAAGWSRHEITHFTTGAGQPDQGWQAGELAPVGLYTAGSALPATSLTDPQFAVQEFDVTFSLARVQIIRPWFSAEFLRNRGWTLRRGPGWNYDEPLSDGGDPPRGRLIGYPAEAIFVKDLSIRSTEVLAAYSTQTAEPDAAPVIGWGPFALSGHYGDGDGGRRFRAATADGTIAVPGMQIIGFVNRLLGKTPDLRGDIGADRLV